MLKKKNWANFQRIIELFTKKIVKKLLKIWSWDPGSGIRDPGSGIRDPEKTYSGSRIQGSKSTQSRIPDPDPQHCFFGKHNYKTNYTNVQRTRNIKLFKGTVSREYITARKLTEGQLWAQSVTAGHKYAFTGFADDEILPDLTVSAATVRDGEFKNYIMLTRMHACKVRPFDAPIL